MPKASIIAGRALTYRRYITRDRRERILLQKISFVYLTKEIFHKVEARQSKPNTPSSDKETSLHLLFRYLAARPSGLVGHQGLEPWTDRL